MIALFWFAAATFVGNDACRPCHAHIVKMYEATPMARSTGKVANNVPPGRFRHAASNIEYTIFRNGSVTVSHGSERNEDRFDYFIGSGAAGFSYLTFRDRYLVQAPITWYSQRKRWDASPGYQHDTAMRWDRQVDPSCLLCHASQLTHIYGTVNRYGEVPFQQPGIACERCHGAGSEHIAGISKMVVSSRLNAERRDDVCRQCHLMGQARIPRLDRTFAQYRAGDRLADFVAYFVYDDPRGPALRSTSHVEGMNASRCKQVSGSNLWCGTCHDVHTMPANPVKWYRDKCQACHKPTDCLRGPNCIACHMPKSLAIDAGHGAFTDHRIARRPERVVRPRPATWQLRPFSASDTGDRELAIAYLQMYQQTRDERQKKEAIRLAKSSSSQ